MSYDIAYAKLDCPECGEVYLTEQQHQDQLKQPSTRWRCPLCNSVADLDDEETERLQS